MRRLLWCSAVFVVASGERCFIASIQPIVTDRDLVRDSSLVGLWVGNDGKDSATITMRNDGSYLYRALSDSTGEDGITLKLTRIGTGRVIETSPANPKVRPEGYFIPIHYFARLESTRPSLTYRLMSASWLEHYFAVHPRAVAHMLDENSILFTDSTAALRAFIAKHQAEPGFWNKDSVEAQYAGPPLAAPANQ